MFPGTTEKVLSELFRFSDKLSLDFYIGLKAISLLHSVLNF